MTTPAYPQIRVVGSVVTIIYRDFLLTFDRFHESSSRPPSAEVIVAGATGRKNAPHRLNLVSVRARREFARVMAERIPRDDWEFLLEESCAKVLDVVREGEPVQGLRRHSERKGPPYAIEPIITSGYPTIVFGPPKALKSYLAALCAVAVDYGVKPLGWNAEPGRTLYLDWEASHEALERRIEMVLNGLGYGSLDHEILYRYCHRPLHQDISRIQSIVAERRITFIVADSAAPAAGEPLKDDIVTLFFNALRSLHVSSLILAHQPKDRERSNTPFGSTMWQARARSVFKARIEQKPQNGEVQMGLFHVNANDVDLLKPMGVRAKFSYDDVQFSRMDVTRAPALAQNLPRKDQVAGFLADGAATTKDVAESLQISEDQARTTLNRMVKAGEATKLSDGRFGLAARHVTEEEAPERW